MSKQQIPENDFTGVNFFFNRTGLPAKNFMHDVSKMSGKRDCTVEIKDKHTGEWEVVKMSLKEFFRDQPILNQ